MKKILVVDDDKPLRTGIATALRRQGYEVLEAADVAAGLALASAQNPSLVLSDVNLAEGNGFELLKELRVRPETLAIPVIFMTGQPLQADARFSMDQGADDYLAKPFQMEELLAAVRARLERQESIQRAVHAQAHAERISTQEKLRLQTLALEAAANGIAITDREGMILWANPAFGKKADAECAEIAGQPLTILNPEKNSREFQTNVWEKIHAGKVWHGELVGKNKDGTRYFEETTITPVCDANGQVHNFLVIKQDVSGRKQMEDMLARERDLLQSLMDNLPDHIYFKDTHSCFTRINLALARHLGLQRQEEAIGKSDMDFFPPIEAGQKLEDERLLLTTGKPILGLLEKSNTASGDKWVSSTKVPIYGKNNEIIGLVGISRDITAFKQAELERQMIELQLRQSQKLETVGQLAAGIAHEINTPTQYVGDNTRFIKESFTAILKVLQSHEELLAAVKKNAVTPELVAQAGEILAASDLDYLNLQIPSAIIETLEGVERIAKIVRAMKEFSHPGSKEKAPADLNKAIESTVTVAHNEWKYVADLKQELEPNLPLVPCFLGEFNQCILNLIVNAAHAIGDVVRNKPGTQGKITIQTRHIENQVEVRVTDTGTGIPESARPKIFEPFFTTKEVGKGTGQGLSMVYGSIVRRHGGTVRFETEVGKGTAFIIRLPLKPKAAPEKNPVQPERLVA